MQKQITKNKALLTAGAFALVLVTAAAMTFLSGSVLSAKVSRMNQEPSTRSSENTSPIDCPAYSPPAPDWCANGTIVPQPKDANGCFGPPKCVDATTTATTPGSGQSGATTATDTGNNTGSSTATSHPASITNPISRFSLTCQDSDGGINAEQKGTVTATLNFFGRTFTQKYTDRNQNKTSILEYYCNNNRVNLKTIKCKNGVDAGACKKNEETQKPDLVVKGIYFYPNIPIKGEKFNGEIRTKIKNIGNEAVQVAPGECLYLNNLKIQSATPIIDGLQSTDLSIGSLIACGPTISENGEISYGLKDAVFNSDVILTSTVDFSNTIPESNENNNSFTKNITLKPAVIITHSCTGATPPNTTMCPMADVGLTANTPKMLVTSCTSAKKCGYIQNTFDCTAVPAHSSSCRNNSSLNTDTPAKLVTSCSIGTQSCEYICATGFVKNENTCVPVPTPPITPATPSLDIAIANDTPPADILVAGANTVHLTNLKITSSKEVVINKLQITNSGNDENIISLILHNGSSQKNGYLTNHVAEFSGLNLTIPANGEKTLQVEANLNSINSGAKSGGKIKIGLLAAGFEAIDQAAGTKVTNPGFTETLWGNEMTVYETKPTVMLASSSPTGSRTTASADGFFIFTVSASTTENVYLNQIKIDLSSDASLNPAWNNELTAYLKSGGTTIATGLVKIPNASSGSITFDFGSTVSSKVITKGISEVFTLQLDTTKLIVDEAGKDDLLTPSIFLGSAIDSGNFWWGDSNTSNIKWVGAGISGLSGNALKY